MATLARATREEIEERLTDPAWWPGVLARIADEGRLALDGVKEENVWSWGAIWRWIQEDDGRVAEYDAALKAYAQRVALEAIPIVDGATPETVAVEKLRSETRLKLAGKWDRERYGERVKVEREAVPAADAGLLVAAADLLRLAVGGRLRGVEAERVVVGEAATAGRVIEGGVVTPALGTGEEK